MEMVAATDVNNVGEDLTPPLHPLAYSLHDSFLFSHCANCFSPLPSPNPLPPPLYCSPSCSSFHSSLHLSSASHHLHPPPTGQTSDLRLALLLLLQINHHQQYDRICGLMSNHRKLLMSTDDDEFSTRIKTGARAIAAATMMRDGVATVVNSESSERYLLEEAVLCVVLTNAVEVQDRVGRSVGVAVYGFSFSWINHSCSPNACYRFLPPETHGGGRQRCLIRPASSDSCEPIDFSTNSDLLTGSPEICGGGPRIVVRSMKPIKKGEQVTIAYTDLLQPKELRQLELWSKYRFTCCCCRCVAVPLTSVDQRLQEISVSNGSLSHNVGVKSFTNYIDDAIDDYISSNDAKSCCNKLENALLNGFHYEQLIIRLHPQHHLSINCYTTLASAYKIRAMDENHLDALKLNRFSAAYSLLLALLTHHLFLSESSLIKSISYFWVGAGEALLNLATSLVSMSNSRSDTDFRSCKCCLIDMFETNFDHGYCSNKVLDISMEFLNCIRDINGKVWKFLVHGNGYLEVVKDLVEFVGDNGEGFVERSEVLGLSGHCLLYGGVLANICGGNDSHLSCYVRRILYDGDGKILHI